MNFTQLSLTPALTQVIADMGYTKLTPVQERCIPLLLAGKDVIGQAKTGSGKTAAFAIGFLENIDVSSRTIQALVLCPTRELVTQVADQIRKLGRYLPNFQVRTIFGGRPANLERRSLEHGVHVIVGTPGRLLDHLSRGHLDFSTVKSVVLDEADRMLDMGFREKIEEILGHTPPTRQTALFSATFPATIQALSRRYQRSPHHVVVETPAFEMPEIQQLFFRCNPEGKSDALVAFLATRPLNSVLVFCNFKINVKDLAARLSKTGLSVDRIHGDLDQHERERVMAKFRNQSIRVLIATDVAGRGLDIAGLDAVINFDMPSEPEQYIHRIGRTGRAGMKGLAVTFITDAEVHKLERLRAATQLELDVKPTSSIPATRLEDPAPSVPMTTLSILGGRKNKLRAGDILGALTGDAGIAGDQVGKIEIQDRVAFVAITRPSAKIAYTYLQHGKIKGRRFQVEWVK